MLAYTWTDFEAVDSLLKDEEEPQMREEEEPEMRRDKEEEPEMRRDEEPEMRREEEEEPEMRREEEEPEMRMEEEPEMRREEEEPEMRREKSNDEEEKQRMDKVFELKVPGNKRGKKSAAYRIAKEFKSKFPMGTVREYFDYRQYREFIKYS